MAVLRAAQGHGGLSTKVNSRSFASLQSRRPSIRISLLEMANTTMTDLLLGQAEWRPPKGVHILISGTSEYVSFHDHGE